MKFTLSSNNFFLFTYFIALPELSLSNHLGKPGNSQKCLKTMGEATKWLVRDAVFFFFRFFFTQEKFDAKLKKCRKSKFPGIINN